MKRQVIYMIIFSLISVTFALFNLKISFADSELSRQDYKLISSNREFVLVMLIPDLGSKMYDVGDQTIRNKYSVSGLYKNDGST